MCWDSRMAHTSVGKIGGHNGPILTMAASPADNGLVTGSEDMRVRYMNVEGAD